MRLKYWIKGSSRVVEGEFDDLEDFAKYTIGEQFNYIKNFEYAGKTQVEKEKLILDAIPAHFVFDVDKNDFIVTDGKNYKHFFLEFSADKVRENLREREVFEKVPEKLFNQQKVEKALEIMCDYNLARSREAPDVLTKWWIDNCVDEYLAEYDYDYLEEHSERFELSFLETVKEQIFYALVDRGILEGEFHSKMDFSAKDENDLAIAYNEDDKALIKECLIKNFSLLGGEIDLYKETLENFFSLDGEELEEKVNFIEALREHIEEEYPFCKELYKVLENLYSEKNKTFYTNYDDFLEKIKENYNGSLADVSENMPLITSKEYADFYDENDFLLLEWLEEEALECGEETELGFLQKHLKVGLEDFLVENGASFKRKLIDAFTYSFSCSIYETIEEFRKDYKQNTNTRTM